RAGDRRPLRPVLRRGAVASGVFAPDAGAAAALRGARRGSTARGRGRHGDRDPGATGRARSIRGVARCRRGTERRRPVGARRAAWAVSPADGTAIALLDGMRRNVQAHAIALWVVGLACVPGSHDARARSLRSLDLDAPGHEAAAAPRSSDPQLMAHVHAALAAQDLAHDDVRVAATKGVVELTGVVPTLLAYDRVASVVRRVRGVRSLSNRLVVAPHVVPDERLHEQVAAVLQE